jgi:hypothetical protein
MTFALPPGHATYCRDSRQPLRTAYLGGDLPQFLEADKKGLPIALTDGPQYLVPEKPNKLLRAAAER